MAKKRKNPMNAAFAFNKDVDIGPQNYQGMDPSMAGLVHEERVRRQVQSRMGVKPKKRKFYTVME